MLKEKSTHKCFIIYVFYIQINTNIVMMIYAKITDVIC